MRQNAKNDTHKQRRKALNQLKLGELLTDLYLRHKDYR